MNETILQFNYPASSKRYEIIRTDKVTIEEMEEYINVLEQYVY